MKQNSVEDFVLSTKVTHIGQKIVVIKININIKQNLLSTNRQIQTETNIHKTNIVTSLWLTMKPKESFRHQSFW